MRTFLVLILFVCAFDASAGDLTPSNSPSPTMRTLVELEPRIAISRTTSPQPLVIAESGSYYLLDDVSSLGDGGIRIDADNVDLDLNGFSVSEGSIVQGGPGILVNGTEVTIRNGFVTDNDDDGIRCALGNRRLRLVDVISTDNGGDGVTCTSLTVVNGDYSRNDGDGIGCGPCRIDGARVVANGGIGILDGFSKGTIRDVIVRNNGGIGIDCPFNEKTLVSNSVIGSNGGDELASGCIAIGTVVSP